MLYLRLLPFALLCAACGSPDKDTETVDLGELYDKAAQETQAMAKGEDEAGEGQGDLAAMRLLRIERTDEIALRTDGPVEITLSTADGDPLLSGMFDRGTKTFIPESLSLFGKIQEEIDDLAEGGDLSQFVSHDTTQAFLALADHGARDEFVRAQGLDEDEEAAQHQLLLAFGGISLMLSRDATHASVPGGDPCEPLDDKDYCTWSPEFFRLACCQHDDCYATCEFTRKKRSECDGEFKENMLDEANWWNRAFVGIYYSAVRWFGEKHYACR